MSTDKYAPSECEVRADFVQTHTRNFDSYLMGRSLTSEQEHYGAQFDAMIARVRRDAAREALDGLAATHDAQVLADFGIRNSSRIGQEARIYRDTHYGNAE